MRNPIDQLVACRRAAGVSQAELASRAGLTRMTVQRTEAGSVDPRLSSLLVMARELGMDLLLVPVALRPDLEAFVHAGGRLLGQPAGVGAPASIAATLGIDAAARPGAVGPQRHR